MAIPIGQGSFTTGDLPVAGTVDLASISNMRIRITAGTGPVTSFGAGTNKIKFVISNTTFTLNHSASLLIPGAANIVVEPGDTFIATSGAAGGWTIFAFQRADGLPFGLDDDLNDIAGLSPSNDDFLQRKAGSWVNRTPAQAKTDLEAAGLAPLASPAFSGNPTAPTQSAGNNTTRLATTAFVIAEINALIAAAPGALNTLDELAAALGDDANFAATVTTALAGKQALHAMLTQLSQNYGVWQRFDTTAVATASHTGTLSETVLKTVTLPAGCLGANGAIRAGALVTCSSHATFTKTLRAKIGAVGAGTGGTTFFNQGFTNVTNFQVEPEIQNRNNQALQVGAPNGLTSKWGSANGGPATPAIDTSAAFDIILTGQLSDTSQTMVIERSWVDIMYKA